MSHVIFRKQVSDGNYGTESAEVLIDIDQDVDDDEVLAAALATARKLVHSELQQSPSANVRRGIEYPQPARLGPRDEDEPY